MWIPRPAIAACGFALVAAQSIAALAWAQQPAPADPIIVIDDVTLIDVENSRALPHQTITIAGERIERIDEASAANIPDGAKIIAGKGLYLIPGLFDAHVHITDSAETFGPMLLANGITAVRDTGGDTDTILALRERSRKRGADVPQIICTGAIVDGDPPVWPFSEACDTPEQAQAAVRKLKAAGVDMIKVYSRLKPEVYRAAVAEAHAQKLKAVGHVPNAVSLAEAIEAGQDCAEHLMGLDKMLIELSGKPEENRNGVWAGFTGWLRYDDIDKTQLRARLALLAKANMMQCPTLTVIQGIGRAANPETAAKDERMAYVPVALRGFWSQGNYVEFGKLAAQMVHNMQAMVGELYKAGVPLMIGTDLANPYVFAGFSTHDEMKMFEAAGIPAIDVLRSATIIPARFCDVDSDLGSIAKDKLASLVLLRANPLDSIANCDEIQGVLVRGVHYDRAALDKMLKGVRDYVANSMPVAAKAGAIDMDLVGELVARGRYVMQFNGQFDSGVEDFVITRDKAGYHIRAHLQPQGGFQAPALVNFNVDPEFKFTAGDMKQLTQKPVTANYVLKDKTLFATAVEGAEGAKPQEFAMPDNGVVTASITAGDFAFYGSLKDMKIDEKRDLQAVGFGFGGWQVGAVPYSVTRKADEDFALTAGTKIKSRHFTTSMLTQGMQIDGETWIDERGVVVKSVLRASFGQVETLLMPEKPQ